MRTDKNKRDQLDRNDDAADFCFPFVCEIRQQLKNAHDQIKTDRRQDDEHKNCTRYLAFRFFADIVRTVFFLQKLLRQDLLSGFLIEVILVEFLVFRLDILLLLLRVFVEILNDFFPEQSNSDDRSRTSQRGYDADDRAEQIFLPHIYLPKIPQRLYYIIPGPRDECFSGGNMVMQFGRESENQAECGPAARRN